MQRSSTWPLAALAEKSAQSVLAIRVLVLLVLVLLRIGKSGSGSRAGASASATRRERERYYEKRRRESQEDPYRERENIGSWEVDRSRDADQSGGADD